MPAMGLVSLYNITVISEMISFNAAMPAMGLVLVYYRCYLLLKTVSMLLCLQWV